MNEYVDAQKEVICGADQLRRVLGDCPVGVLLRYYQHGDGRCRMVRKSMVVGVSNQTCSNGMARGQSSDLPRKGSFEFMSAVEVFI